MNRLIVTFLAGVFAFGSASVCSEDQKQLETEKLEPSKSAETPKEKASKPRDLPTKEDKAKAIKQAGGNAQRPASSQRPATGGFAPHYGHENDQLRRERQTQQQPTTAKSAEERAARKQLVDEWEKTQPPAPK